MGLIGTLWQRITRHATLDRPTSKPGSRSCRLEQMEPRMLLAADLHLGAVYFEEATGDDTAADTIQVTYEGGAADTQLSRLVIDGDKKGNGRLEGDIFFDIADGGLGAFGHVGLTIESHRGFEVTGVSVADGSSKIVFTFSGFDAGEKLVFSIDVDELSFIDNQSGTIDATSVAEGGEFQRTRMSAEFAAPHYERASLDTRFWDAFDTNFTAAAAATGSTLDLPDDRYVTTDDLSDRTAGAVVHATQTPLPIMISGTVFADENLDNVQSPSEDGIAGVTVGLWVFNTATNAYVDTGRVAATDDQGQYQFDGNAGGAILPGRYEIRETQPAGYQSVGATAGSVDGATTGEVLNPDTISRVDLVGGQDSIHNDFAEALPAELSGYVYHDRDDDGRRDAGEEGIEGVDVLVLPVATLDGSTAAVHTTTDASGFWSAAGLAPGEYRVVEPVQPAGYLDGLDAAGTVNGVPVGAAENPHGDRIDAVVLGSGDPGIEYNFGELLPGSISGSVHASIDGDCVFDPDDIPLANVQIDLLDAQDNLIASTLTDADGRYTFDDVAPGEYQIFEHQPDGYFDGDDRPGTAGGVSDGIDTISGIDLTSGTDVVDYNFCEHIGIDLSGFVYHDADNDGVFDASESGIAGAVLNLLDEAGHETGAMATTNESGFYVFRTVRPGIYGIAERQPSDYLDGLDTPGNLGGTAHDPGDRITDIALLGGLDGENYNFGELLPGSIAGSVFVDADHDWQFSAGDSALQNVAIELVDGASQVVATTATDATGQYRFTDLRTGVYSVHEFQPTGFFQGDEHIGSGGGEVSAVDRIGQIAIASDAHLVEYDFTEVPPASLSGFVFQDGERIDTLDGRAPDNLHELRDGRRSDDDTPLSGVTLELRHGVTGEPIQNSTALPGTYTAGPIRTTTDSQGFYQFVGLPPGVYAVFEVQPSSFIDGVDTPGSLGGLAVNPGDGLSPLVLSQLAFDPADDAILRIPLPAAQQSTENNFSEVLLGVIGIPEDPPEVVPTPILAPAGVLAPPSPAPLPRVVVPVDRFELFGGSSRVLGYTWHLSVIDGGQPRASGTGDAPTRFAGSQFEASAWHALDMRQSAWTFAVADLHAAQTRRQAIFGNADARPVVGDFNGDGITDVGIFLDGEWYIDLDGNGRWDEGDLWAKLGHRGDLPITGDWDGDGKTDIGIFGPAWSGDPLAIHREPGLPDHQNVSPAPWKNVPPTPDQAAAGVRGMRLTSQGKIRSDLVDHVFHYGTAGDTPVTGDWNGDGIDTIGVFRDGAWNLDVDGDGKWTEPDGAFEFGRAGDIPVVGDWNGDGVDQIGVYRTGRWLLDTNGDRHLDARDKVFELGGSGDLPVVGDWNGDGRDEPGVYHPTAARQTLADD